MENTEQMFDKLQINSIVCCVVYFLFLLLLIQISIL